MIVEYHNFRLELLFIPKEGGCWVTNVCKLYHNDVLPRSRDYVYWREFDLLYSLKEYTMKHTVRRKSYNS